MNNNNVSPSPIHDTPHVSSFNVGEPKKKKPTLSIIIGVAVAAALFLIIWFVFLKKLPISFFKTKGEGVIIRIRSGIELEGRGQGVHPCL